MFNLSEFILNLLEINITWIQKSLKTFDLSEFLYKLIELRQKKYIKAGSEIQFCYFSIIS